LSYTDLIAGDDERAGYAADIYEARMAVDDCLRGRGRRLRRLWFARARRQEAGEEKDNSGGADGARRAKAG
jgi:hypothetical protein